MIFSAGRGNRLVYFIWQNILLNLMKNINEFTFLQSTGVLKSSYNINSQWKVWVTIIHLTHIQCAHCRRCSGGHRHGLPQSQVPDGALEGGHGPLRGIPHPAHPRLFLQVGASIYCFWKKLGKCKFGGNIVKLRLRVIKGKGWSKE